MQVKTHQLHLVLLHQHKFHRFGKRFIAHPNVAVTVKVCWNKRPGKRLLKASTRKYVAVILPDCWKYMEIEIRHFYQPVSILKEREHVLIRLNHHFKDFLNI